MGGGYYILYFENKLQHVPTFHMQTYAVYLPEGRAVSQYSVFIGQYMHLILAVTGQNKLRNAICVQVA